VSVVVAGPRVVVVSVGRLGRDGPVASAVRDYEARAGRYWSLTSVEVRQEPARSLPVDSVRAREWTRLADALSTAAADEVVVCDERGASMTSPAFASWLSSRRSVAFVIGGAFGLPADARSSASSVLSLAPWTLPHDLARLLLAEQLYRAGTIVRGEPYHK
jgi:23S rRNA (pseudouridine1915-N3)-methyltransferase